MLYLTDKRYKDLRNQLISSGKLKMTADKKGVDMTPEKIVRLFRKELSKKGATYNAETGEKTFWTKVKEVARGKSYPEARVAHKIIQPLIAQEAVRAKTIGKTAFIDDKTVNLNEIFSAAVDQRAKSLGLTDEQVRVKGAEAVDRAANR